MNRTHSLRLLAGLALLLLQAPFAVDANAMFIDRFVAQWRAARLARHDAELLKLPLFDSKFFSLRGNNAEVVEGTFDQKVNHFDAGDARTFKQRYWVNSSYASGFDAPVFYYICGESRCSPGGGFTTALAKENHAYVITLEHRYYGDSIPVVDYSAGNLRYLSTEQALADLDQFQGYVRGVKKLTGAWIAVGGSYSGSLSAYYRLTQPGKIAGSLASSGPVEARAEFEEYDFQIATGVPASCLSAVQRVTAEIEDDLRTEEGRAAVKRLFGSSEIRDDVDFLYVVADMAAIAVQYGSREKFCKTIENSSDAKAAYAKIGLELFAGFGMTPLEDTVQGNLSTNPNDYRSNGMRQWLYQSCAQYGYWQVAYHDPRLSSRSRRIDLAFHNNICTRMFGMSGTVDTRGINSRYYAPIVAGKISRTLFTNGSDDPWQHLSITPARRNVPPTVDAVLMKGAAHCDDLGMSGLYEVTSAQDRFRGLLKGWLSSQGYRWVKR